MPNTKSIMYSKSKTEELLLELSERVWVPKAELNDTAIDQVTLKSQSDLNKIPKSNGAYWIVTNEPVPHSMTKYSGTPRPKKFGNGYEVIYNGIAQDLRKRIKDHLFRAKVKGQSGISVDIYSGNETIKSHVKTAFNKSNKKYKYVGDAKIDDIEKLKLLNLSPVEKAFVKNNPNIEKVYFWNGINVTWEKHKFYTWKVYYFQNDDKIFTDIIEKKWREQHGLPRLCTYKAGR
jgi:hypothetical protein